MERSAIMAGKNNKLKLMMRGSIIMFSRKCGKKNCKCAQGEPHQGWALSYSLNGKTKMITFPEENLPEVKAALKRYEKAKAALEAQALAGIEQMRKKIREQKKK